MILHNRCFLIQKYGKKTKMYIFKTCAAICENFVRDLLTFIHSNWKRTIKTPDFHVKIERFSDKKHVQTCPNLFKLVQTENHLQTENHFQPALAGCLGLPPRGGNPSSAKKRLIFLASVLSLSPSPPAKTSKKTQKNSLIFSKLSNVTLI